MATSNTDFDHPYYEILGNKSLKERVEFFTENSGKRMKFISLGEALDFVSVGGGNFVAYNFGTKELTKYIQIWMDSQKPKIEYEKVQLDNGSYTYKETSREYGYLWNRFHFEKDVELPYINHNKCPRCERGHNHTELVHDRIGRLRCADVRKEKFKPNYISGFRSEDFLSATSRNCFSENEPDIPEYTHDENICDSIEYKIYLKKKEKFNNEEATEIVSDVCYSIIKEPKNIYLPLEIVLDRLNCVNKDNQTFHPFSGFTLANFVKSWHEQKGENRIWKRKGELDFYREFKDFVIISTDD